MWLRNPQAVKPGSLMVLPRPLSEDEIKALVAYLRAHQ
jgi:cytochrome c1